MVKKYCQRITTPIVIAIDSEMKKSVTNTKTWTFSLLGKYTENFKISLSFISIILPLKELHALLYALGTTYPGYIELDFIAMHTMISLHLPQMSIQIPDSSALIS